MVRRPATACRERPRKPSVSPVDVNPATARSGDRAKWEPGPILLNGVRSRGDVVVGTADAHVVAEESGDDRDRIGHQCACRDGFERVGETRDAEVEASDEADGGVRPLRGTPPPALEIGNVALHLTEVDAVPGGIEVVLLDPTQDAVAEVHLPTRRAGIRV